MRIIDLEPPPAAGPGRSMALRNFCSIPQAVSWRVIPNWRRTWTADTPGVWVVIGQAVSNQSVSEDRV